MMQTKWVTVTLNPAIDLTGRVEHLMSGHVNIAQKLSSSAAGKGINVAKVLADLGETVTVTGFLGDANQESFKQYFELNGLNDHFISVAGTNRTNVKIREATGSITDINFNGFQVSDENIADLGRTLMELAQSHDGFVFSGSLPVNLAESQVLIWIKQLKSMNKKVVLDSSKAMLSAGIDAIPWMIKPNEQELSELLGREISTMEEGVKAAQELSAKGIEHVLVSFGEKGVLWLTKDTCLMGKPPLIETVSTVGAGDSLVAGFCWASQRNMSEASTLAHAAALGTLAVMQQNVGLASQSKLLDMASQIQIESAR